VLKVIIIDDENNAVKTLQSYLDRYVKDVVVVGVANSKKEAVQLINDTNFHLILLDINLGDGTGFEALEESVDKDFFVIFTTAYDQHAIKAFKYSALDYLLKPINPEEFMQAIERVRALKEKVQKSQISNASEIVKTGKINKIVINSSNEIHFLEIAEVIRLESYKNYTDIFLIDGRKITSTKTLKFYENLLSETHFFRIHQKHLVNTLFIKKFLKEDGGYVLLTNKSKLEVSRRRKEDLLKTLTK